MEEAPVSQLRLRPLGFGEILDGAFTLYRNNFPTLFTTALLSVIPITLLSWSLEGALLSTDADSPAAAGVVGAMMLMLPLSLLLWSILWGALTRQTAEAYEGQRPTLRDGYARAFRSLPAFLVAWIVVGLLAMVVFISLLLLATVASIPMMALTSSDSFAMLFASVMMVLTAVVMAIAMTSLFALFPAILVERQGPWGAIKRSHQLARGGRLRILGVMLVSFLIVLLPTLGLMMAGGMGAAMWDISVAATLSPMQVFVQHFITILTSALTTPFMVASITLLYFDRRVRSEGYDLEVAADNLAAQAL